MAHRAGPALRSTKRSREYVSLAEARDAVKRILELAEDDLCDAGKRTLLPYPGLGRSCTRPAVDLNYVGRSTLEKLLTHWEMGLGRELLVYGPKGVGKSSDFRAMACILYKWLHIPDSDDEPDEGQKCTKRRVVFLWAETLLIGPVQAVKDALLFSFLVDELERVDGWLHVQAEIMDIRSMQDALDFIDKRKKQEPEPEIFYFLVDGGEKLDPTDFLGNQVFKASHRSTVAADLVKLLDTGARVWWCTSPKAKMLTEKLQVPWIVYERRGFNEEEYSKYAATCVLGKLTDRLSSIEYYTGFVPLFLDALCTSCETVVRDLELEEGLYSDKAALQASNEEMAEVLEEDEYWDAVLKTFLKHNELIAVRERAEKIQVQGECGTDAAMAHLDPTYVLDAEKGEYCSSYIKRVYLQAVRSKEEAAKPYADGAWMSYARRLLLDKKSVDWSSLGRLCEDVLANRISKRGLILGDLQLCGHITVQDFDTIPSRNVADLQHLKPNSGYYFKPLDVSFPDVDGVMVWVDEKGNLHVVGLQYTVNIDRHFKSVDQFMSLTSLKCWLPDIEDYIGNSKINLHFAFLGCSSRQGYSSGKQDSKIRKLRNGMMSGTPEYVLHIQPFDDKAFPGLSMDDYSVLVEITSHRTWNSSYADVCDEGLGFISLKRRDLEKMAGRDYGISDPSHKKYRNKALLINAMLEAADAWEDEIERIVQWFEEIFVAYSTKEHARQTVPMAVLEIWRR